MAWNLGEPWLLPDDEFVAGRGHPVGNLSSEILFHPWLVRTFPRNLYIIPSTEATGSGASSTHHGAKSIPPILRRSIRHERLRWAGDNFTAKNLPAEGVEPTLPCGKRILSPSRLPVPPRRLGTRHYTPSHAQVKRPFIPKPHLRKAVSRRRAKFDIKPHCAPQERERAARTSVALDKLVAAKDLGSLAYYHRGLGNTEHEDVISWVILGTSLLTAHGIPVTGEYEVKNAQAMKIIDAFGSLAPKKWTA
jgi:hypothetical protein